MDQSSPLDRGFFERPTDEVAAALIGCLFSTYKDGQLTGGWIVETEAYGGADDLASHAAIYHRSRKSIMSGSAGIAYVYRSYGVHACFNVVAHPHGESGAVLIRAIEPLAGIAAMTARRGVKTLKLLCSGPGRLTQALGIRLEDDGRDVVADDVIRITQGRRPDRLVALPRVGISRDVERTWRFCDGTTPFLSRQIRDLPDASMTP